MLAGAPRAHRGGARTTTCGRDRRPAYAGHTAGGASRRATGSVGAVSAFHVCGLALAAWALIAAFLGITRENFPGSPGAERVVAAISILLALAAIGSGIYTGITEEEEEEGGEGAAVVLPI
jgi:hypothetical protein